MGNDASKAESKDPRGDKDEEFDGDVTGEMRRRTENKNLFQMASGV